MCMDPKPRNPKENKVTVLGLGGAGGQILHYIAEQEGKCNENYNLLYADDDEQSLLESTVKAIRVADYKGKDIENLINEIQGSEKLIIVGGLGGGFGTLAVPMIIYIAEELELDFELLLSYPAKFEGKKRCANANLIAGLLNQFNIHSTIFEFDELIKTLDEKVRLCDCFRIMDDVLYQKVKEVLE